MRRLLRTGLGALVVAAAIAAVAVAPHWLSQFRASQFATAGVYFIAIVGLNLLTGYTGQISLGHGALMAVGGYTTAVLVSDYGIRDVWTIPLAGLAAGIAGFIVGLPALRLTGLYLALATFALAVAMPALIKKASSLTGGSQGINLFDEGLGDLTGALSGEVSVLGYRMLLYDFFYYLTWTIALVLGGVAWLLVRGRLGRAFRAIKDSEVAAASSGVNLSLYKTLAFAISGFYAGVAGSLLAIIIEFVNPQSFTFNLSLWLLVGSVVGGLGSLAGLAAGAFFVEFLPVAADELSDAPGVPSVFFGATIVLVMILLPSGLGGLLRRIVRPLTTQLYTRP